MPEHWWFFACLVAGGWLFHDGMKVRELALRAGRDYCRTISVQFLDDTVSRQRIALARDGSGSMRIRRDYGFEFTSDGDRRYTGGISMLGSSVTGVQVELHRIVH